MPAARDAHKGARDAPPAIVQALHRGGGELRATLPPDKPAMQMTHIGHAAPAAPFPLIDAGGAFI
jgi:hypothetical protein